MESVENRVESTGVVAIVRLSDYSTAVKIAKALLKGGIDVVEFTYTNSGAGQAIERVKAALGADVLAGALQISPGPAAPCDRVDHRRE